MTYYPEVMICKMRTLVQSLQTGSPLAKSTLYVVGSAVFRKFELVANILKQVRYKNPDSDMDMEP